MAFLYFMNHVSDTIEDCVQAQERSMISLRNACSYVLVCMFLFSQSFVLPTAHAAEITWTPLSHGLSISVWNPGRDCSGTLPALIMVRINPEAHQFSTYHYRDEGMQRPVTTQDWQRHTGDAIVFNAGLFFEDFSYIGLLFKEGRSLGSKRHPSWKGLFVAEPSEEGLRKARVMDLDQETFPVTSPKYGMAAQSLMLIDEKRKIRVRKSAKRAHQTVVVEEKDGNILLIKTADTVTLWNLAMCLRNGLSTIHHAMSMDGGPSSDLFIAPRLLANTSNSGIIQSWEFVVDGTGSGHIPLPAIIGISPRPIPPQPSRPNKKK